jgi:hypothetical protein
MFYSIFTTNKRPDAFIPTSTLDRHCKALELAAEFPSDDHILQLARIQKLAQTIVCTMAENIATDLQNMQYPLMIVIRSFQQQINDIRRSLPVHLQNSSRSLNSILQVSFGAMAATNLSILRNLKIIVHL